MQNVATKLTSTLTGEQLKQVRIAPFRDGRAAASFWKLWANGNEFYAVKRTPGTVAKISIHESGQIHYRLHGKHLQVLGPVVECGLPGWTRALQINTLLSGNARWPNEVFKRPLPVLGVQVKPGHFVTMSVYTGEPGSVMPRGYEPMWQAQLKNGRQIALRVQTLPYGELQIKELIYERFEVAPKADMHGKSAATDHAEMMRIARSDDGGGNVVFVVPLGDEVFVNT